MRKVVNFVRLSRLHFLLGGFLMFALGSVAEGIDSWSRYVITQVMVTATQLTAHYVNEYADFEADKRIENRTSFSGGSGVLQSGALSRSVALHAGQVTSAVAAISIALVGSFSLAAAVVGIVALLVAWAYSMPPVRLLSTGAGEIATAITVAVLVPATGSLAQAGSIPDELWWVMCVLLPLQFAMLLTFELPDMETDALAGKRVLAIRIGRRRTIEVAEASLAMAACLVLCGWLTGGITSSVALGASLGAPAAGWALVEIESGKYNSSTFAAVATFFLSGAGMTLAFALS